jgi:hypothetical protein
MGMKISIRLLVTGSSAKERAEWVRRLGMMRCISPVDAGTPLHCLEALDGDPIDAVVFCETVDEMSVDDFVMSARLRGSACRIYDVHPEGRSDASSVRRLDPTLTQTSLEATLAG